MAEKPSEDPAMPEKLKSVVTQEGEVLRVRCRNQEGGGFFLLLWLTGWTVGCVFLAGMVFAKQEAFMLLFAVPFWASWIFVAILVAKRFFQVEELEVYAGGARVFRRIGSWAREQGCVTCYAAFRGRRLYNQ